MASSPPLVISGCIQVKLAFVGIGGAAYNVLHFTKAGSATIDQTDAEAIDAAAKTAWTANMAPRCASNVGLARASVRDLSSPNQPEYAGSGATVVGSDPAGDSLPGGVALCVTIRTALSGKSFRGRVYVGLWNENNNDLNGLPVPAAATAAVGFLSDFATAMESLGFVLGVASRPANASQLIRRTGLPNGDIQEEVLSSTTQKAGTITPFTALQSRTLAWETQRRRQNGRGGQIAALAATTSRARSTR